MIAIRGDASIINDPIPREEPGENVAAAAAAWNCCACCQSGRKGEESLEANFRTCCVMTFECNARTRFVFFFFDVRHEIESATADG